MKVSGAWQWVVMKKLADIFKRTQFIGTSHSPLMVQSMPNANFAIMKKGENGVEIENDPEKIKGWRIDQILNSEYFGVPFSRPPETEKLFADRDKLLLKTNRTQQEEKDLKTLNYKILKLRTETNPDDDRAMLLLQQAAELLKTSKTKKDDTHR